MIEILRPVESAAADDIAVALREMVVAFREIRDESVTAPLVRDGETTVREPADIAAFLEQLRRDVTAWNAFQSDACFIDEDGTVC